MKLFGWIIKRDKSQADKQDYSAPVSDEQSEAALNVTEHDAFGSPYGFSIDLEQKAQNVNDAIEKYRQIAGIPEVDNAIEEVVSDMFVMDGKGYPVYLNLDELELSDNIKNKIHTEFNNIMDIMDFAQNGNSIARRWYIDGRIHYYIVIDQDKPSEGIQSLRYIDPRKIQKVRQISTGRDSEGFEYNKSVSEFYVYDEEGISQTTSTKTNKPISKDTIAYADSGLYDPSAKMVLSHLHKAIKIANNLQRLEDAVVVYRLSRAPERRIFYIDVGNLPKGRAQQYMEQISSKYKTRLVYDINTGSIRDESRHMAMTEDYWIPRREGSRGTEIDTLQGGENLGEIADLDYFKNKMYNSLNVPRGRLEPDSGAFNRGMDVTRDELKFSRFIQRLRANFNELFYDLLGKQLILKNIMTLDEWYKHRKHLYFEYNEDNHISESFQSEILQTRLEVLDQASQYVGTYFSRHWAQENILNMSDEDIKEEEKKIKEEGSDKSEEEENGF